MELACPKCGKVGRSAKPIPPGKVVRCPGCGEAFRASPSEPEAGPAALPIVIDETPVIREKKSPQRAEALIPPLVLVVLMPLVFGVGVIAGRMSAPKASEPIPASPTTTPMARAEDDFNRVINPMRTATIYWSEPEARIRELCVGAASHLTERDHLIGGGEIATLLVICGRSECEWRGQEKCVGADFTIGLYVEMLLEGTRPEDALRILAKTHRMRPGVERNQTAASCETTRKTVYEILKKGRIISVENSLDQFLSNVNLGSCPHSIAVHRPSGLS